LSILKLKKIKGSFGPPEADSGRREIGRKMYLTPLFPLYAPNRGVGRFHDGIENAELRIEKIITQAKYCTRDI